MLRFAIVFALALTGSAAAQNVVDYLGIPGPIALGNTSYELAWSSHPVPHYTKHEYVPEGQAVENYQSMVMIDFLAGDVTPMSMVETMMASLEERKATDPMVNMELLENQSTGEVILDFLLSAPDADGNIILEWNAYRYASMQDADGTPGALLFAVSHRAYGDEAAADFITELGPLREEQIALLAGADLPEL
jgi:hypothetical protein